MDEAAKMRVVSSDELQRLVGTDIGTSDWITVDQSRIDAFADVTEDHQFIHVDKEAAAKTPFGTTIAHGFLSLSLLSRMVYDCGLSVEGVKAGVNYGFDRVRFVSPVKSGARIRGHFTLKSVEETRPGYFLSTYAVSVEIEGESKPALTANWLGLQITV